MRRWVLNARLITRDGEALVGHVAVEGAWIADVVFGPAPRPGILEQVIDAAGLWLFPGFVDVHVHLREPGQTEKETIEQGTCAAARGGFATVVMMPNTDPPIDRSSLLLEVLRRAARTGRVRTYAAAAITEGQKGQSLVDMAALARLGAVGFTDDGRGIERSDVMRAALLYARAVGRPIMMHSEDARLSKGGVFRPEAAPVRRGVRPWPPEAEAVPLFRDVLLAAETGARYHAMHVSTSLSLEALALGRRLGADVSAEVTPHHLALAAEDIPDPDVDAGAAKTMEAGRNAGRADAGGMPEKAGAHAALGVWKMNPPLAPRRDVAALRAALLAGEIEIIATDHAPHTAEEKARPIDVSPFGIVGLETAFPLLYTTLVRPNILPLRLLVRAMSTRPAERFGLPGGRIAPGEPADLTLVDLDTPRTVDPRSFCSKGQNTPLAGRELFGWPVLTVVGGRLAFVDASVFGAASLYRRRV
ncbi:MAG: dihydroorotase [Hydrogenibacillus sp.]|nr:dihydroorotase [Hydrogenibacillus sp.]